MIGQSSTLSFERSVEKKYLVRREPTPSLKVSVAKLSATFVDKEGPKISSRYVLNNPFTSKFINNGSYVMQSKTSLVFRESTSGESYFMDFVDSGIATPQKVGREFV